MKRPIALITGASSGIGLSFSRELATRGYDLILVARREDRLKSVAADLSHQYEVECRIEVVDLANPDAVKPLVDRLLSDGLEIEVLINNAGYGLSGSFLSRDWEEHEDFLRVLLLSVCELTHRLLPGMKERGKGRIIQVSSVAGFVPGTAGHTLYGAVKAALNLFTECLALECKNSGVLVTALCPGFTLTEFHDVNGTRARMSGIPGFMWLNSDRVAREALEDCERGEVYCIPGIFYRTLIRALELMPAGLRRYFVASSGSSYRDAS
ncbi:MAG TPA: dehydrogenase [Planctomycetes bacterium]|nr:dehydrogenase [Planctomycetota bacterium]